MKCIHLYLVIQLYSSCILGMTDIRDMRFSHITDFTDKTNLLKIVDRGPFSYVSVKDKSMIDQVADASH